MEPRYKNDFSFQERWRRDWRGMGILSTSPYCCFLFVCFTFFGVTTSFLYGSPWPESNRKLLDGFIQPWSHANFRNDILAMGQRMAEREKDRRRENWSRVLVGERSREHEKTGGLVSRISWKVGSARLGSWLGQRRKGRSPVSFFKMTNVENTFPVTRNPGGGGFGWGLELWANGQQQTSREGQLASLSLRHAYYHPEVKIRTTKHRKYKKIEEKKAKIVKWGLGLNKELWTHT